MIIIYYACQPSDGSMVNISNEENFNPLRKQFTI